MAKNDAAWDRYFEGTNTLELIRRDGHAFVTAKELKQHGKREPRLMAKQDTLATRPRCFRKHDIGILPVTNGRYVLFSDPEHRSYYRFSDADLDLPAVRFDSRADLSSFDSYPTGGTLSESQAIDFAHVSGLLAHVTGDAPLYLTIRGRLYSGHFGFRLPVGGDAVEVSGVQIEVDAGYETARGIYLFEAKMGKRDDFHVRQLYYPFLEWSRRTRKPVRTFLLTYSNSNYYFYEFQFTREFATPLLVRRACHSVNQTPTVDLDLVHLRAIVPPEDEPRVPYPQANDLDRVVDLVSLVEQGIHTKAEIADVFEFDERQGDYYANAARYLGLLDREDGRYVLTDTGRELLSTRKTSQRTLILVQQMLKRPSLREALTVLERGGRNPMPLCNDQLAPIIARHTTLTGTTPGRRASTIRSWLGWVARSLRTREDAQ